ncbi:MAG TPA: S49 family peptidase [Chitinophagaceae bacterium]|nr:S49 family peptidase [Chitinophagaceae bacterium]
MSFRLMSSILRQPWSIERRYVESILPLVLNLLKGHPASFIERTGNDLIEQPFAIDPKTMERQPVFNNPGLVPNSVGVIPINGPITKYNGECEEPGMVQRTTWLMQMQKIKSIGSIVQLMDTPGGECRAAHGYCTQMKKANKPILSYVDAMSASLGNWFTSSSDETYLSNETCEMGSIGTMCTFLDFREYFEMNGVKWQDVYATDSTEKNKAYKDALDGDTSGIVAELDVINKGFIQHIKSQRPATAATANEWRHGKMFFAKDAVRIGLADGIWSFDKVVSKAAWLAQRK